MITVEKAFEIEKNSLSDSFRIYKCTEVKSGFLFATVPNRWDGIGDPPSSGILDFVNKDGERKSISTMDSIDIVLNDLPNEPKEIDINEYL